MNRRFNMCSDKEIIEYLDEEIKQYRNRIKQQNRIIDELSKKTIQSEEMVLEDTEELVDKDIEEITSTTIYIEGRPIKTIMAYKYKEEARVEAEPDSNEDWTRYEDRK